MSPYVATPLFVACVNTHVPLPLVEDILQQCGKDSVMYGHPPSYMKILLAYYDVPKERSDALLDLFDVNHYMKD